MSKSHIFLDKLGGIIKFMRKIARKTSTYKNNWKVYCGKLTTSYDHPLYCSLIPTLEKSFRCPQFYYESSEKSRNAMSRNFFLLLLVHKEINLCFLFTRIQPWNKRRGKIMIYIFHKRLYMHAHQSV